MSQQGKTGDKETDEILAEMEAEGLELPAFAGDKGGETEDNSDQTTTDPELEESEEESDEDDSEEDDEKDSDEDEDDDESDESDDEDDEEESDEDDDSDEEDDEDEPDSEHKQGKRLSLVQKYRREKKLRKAAEAAAAAAVAGNSEATFEKEVKEFAEKNRMNVDVARGLIELAAKRSGVPKEVLADIEATRAERRNREYWADQRKKFDKDFNANVVPVLRSQGADDAKIREVYGQMNGSFDADGVPQSSGSQGWAWGKANKGKSLVELALAVGGGKTTRHSSEGGSRGRTRSAPQKDPGEMSGDDINSMSDEEFDSFSDGLGKQTRSVVHRS